MIRFATEQDATAIVEIYNDAILHTTAVYKYEVESVEERLAWLQQKAQDNFPVLVFEDEGEVAGFATYGLFRLYPGYRYTIENSVYVHPNHVRKGIASKLMKALIEHAEHAGYKTIIACIDATNDASIVMHEKFGFTKSGVIENAGYKFDKWLHLALYQLQLTGPSDPK
jgi:L-amino acid N-acyltransferase